ncbi:uncharacterized protein CTHT_0073440 [Thermochaetoides thermophila DSM 1495]|uniref:Uncharacterized protein n=1 Tax=Chaetomium thermophilum (strain DSM 1495 / CBS 144.50 / IMI 039719) TaxID=759272 RepID=G0SHU8_CHATD|nr:hypothetical protein CTHT_0073440 [Thermochaetoides thermophila DSM 1495]EGS17018.1 hypothetical protein CTHT_0073440 [Thermochaetoides thermophila DSM 1495]
MTTIPSNARRFPLRTLTLATWMVHGSPRRTSQKSAKAPRPKGESESRDVTDPDSPTDPVGATVGPFAALVAKQLAELAAAKQSETPAF